MTQINKSQERALIRRLVDGDLTQEEFRSLEQRLREDSAFRVRYLMAMNLEASLYREYNGTSPQTTSSVVKKPLPRNVVFALVGVPPLLLASLLFCAWYLDFAGLLSSQAGPAVSQSEEAKPVAVVTWVDPTAHDSSAGPAPGARVKPGPFVVDRGQVQLEFLNGVQICLVAPAELSIVSGTEALLVSGKAAARVPPAARGFLLNTPDAAIIDLGTEFTVATGDPGESEVHVVEGEVSVSLLGSDGNTLTSRLLTEPKSLRVSRKTTTFETIDQPTAEFPVIHSQKATPLVVNEDYVAAVRRSNPLIYWRFETSVDGRVPNEVGPRWSGQFHSAANAAPETVIRSGEARFSSTAPLCRIEPDEAIPAMAHDAYTFEFWVAPDFFHRGTLVAVVPDDSPAQDAHLCLIELPYDNRMVFPPGSFRFLHRYPPGEFAGLNIFSNRDCTPGFWHHLVATKTRSGMRFFVNGQLIRELDEAIEGDQEAYRFFLGCLFEGGDRPFSGAMDEFAFYLRALSPEEVAEHYRLMNVNPSIR